MSRTSEAHSSTGSPQTTDGSSPGSSQVRERLEELLRKDPQGLGGEPLTAVLTGWTGLDRALHTAEGLPGLARGALHEWFGLASAGPPARPSARPSGGIRGAERSGGEDFRWTPPLSLFAHLAGRAQDEGKARREERGSSQAAESVLWIGRRVWPYPATLAFAGDLCGRVEPARFADALAHLALELVEDPPGPRARTPVTEQPLFARSFFVDPPDVAARLWAIDAALRCPSVTAVVADGEGFPMAATRRLQLAAQEGEALALLARPPWEEGEISAATTRWRVRRAPRDAGEARRGPRWTLELLRAKGVQHFESNRSRDPAKYPCDASSLSSFPPSPSISPAAAGRGRSVPGGSPPAA